MANQANAQILIAGNRPDNPVLTKTFHCHLPVVSCIAPQLLLEQTLESWLHTLEFWLYTLESRLYALESWLYALESWLYMLDACTKPPKLRRH